MASYRRRLLTTRARKARAAQLTYARQTQVAPMDTVPGPGYYGRFGTRAARRQSVTQELKFFDTALSFNFDATGEVPASGQLCLIPQGDTESTRDGRQAIIKSIQIRLNLLYDPQAAIQACPSVFLYLVLDTQCNGAAAANTDVFTSADLSVALLQLNNSKRFRILKKWNYIMQPTAAYYNAAAFAQPVRRTISFYKRCNIPIDWNSTAGAITEIRTNNIFLMAGSIGGDDTVGALGTARLRFIG